MDADHTEDVPSASMKFRTVAYGKDVQATVDNDKGCDSTLWGSDMAPINGKLVSLDLIVPEQQY